MVSNSYDPVEKYKNGQNGHHSIESRLLSQSCTGYDFSLPLTVGDLLNSVLSMEWCAFCPFFAFFNRVIKIRACMEFFVFYPKSFFQKSAQRKMQKFTQKWKKGSPTLKYV